MNHTPYEYHYGNEADQYTFYRLPKALFTNPRFKSLSDGAKLLYGLMLDRMSLSMKNEWLDKDNKVFIIFTLEEAQEYMGCKHEKAVKMFAELDMDKGVGLIERRKQGQGKPTIIYVLKFVDTAEVKTSEKQKSRLPKIGSQDFCFSDASNNNINKTDLSDFYDGDDDDARADEKPENREKQPAAELPPEEKMQSDESASLAAFPPLPPDAIATAGTEAERLFANHTDRRPAKPDIDRVAGKVFVFDCADPPRWVLQKDRLDLLEYAVDAAFAAGEPGKWSYIDGILDKLEERGIRTLADAHRYDALRHKTGD
ncbi:MAG: replication initiator protein A [Oscillospiraceae bacterium]|jgi:hypothetical protein|nr:replication initiator protein A [Oscillospiraceae bacterium]